MPKSYFDHISETIDTRDLIFGICAHWALGNKSVQSGHQVEPPPQVAPPTCKNLILTISQRLLKLEI